MDLKRAQPTLFASTFKNRTSNRTTKVFKRGVIFDEPQHVPDLFSYIQVISDDSAQTGKFVIPGSQVVKKAKVAAILK